jgi:hypothetical protein
MRKKIVVDIGQINIHGGLRPDIDFPPDFISISHK